MKDRPNSPEEDPSSSSWARRHERYVPPAANRGDRLEDPDPERTKMRLYGDANRLLKQTIDNAPIGQQYSHGQARGAKSHTVYEGSEWEGVPSGYPQWQLEDYGRNADGTKAELPKTGEGHRRSARFVVPGEPDAAGRPTQHEYDLLLGAGQQQSVSYVHTALDFPVARGDEPSTAKNDGTERLDEAALTTPDEYKAMYDRLAWAVDNIA